jgi:hypothetical protein
MTLLRHAVLIALCACGLQFLQPVQAGGVGNEWYVSPKGRTDGSGTQASPWDLATALRGAHVRPGDTILLRGGVYRGPFESALTGTSEAPITVRSYPGERAVLVDLRSAGSGGTINIKGAWTIYRDFDVTNTNPSRLYEPLRRPMAIQVQSPNTKLINLVIRDAGNGIGFWKEAINSEIYGCIIFNGGQYDPSDGGRGHGHGIYTQNNEGTKLIADNVIFNQFGWGIHVYPNPGEIRGYRIEGNAVFDNGRWEAQDRRYNNLLVNGYKPYEAERISITDNYLYHSGAQQPINKFSDSNVCLSCADGITNHDVKLLNNYVVNGVPSVVFGKWTDIVVKNNTFVSSDLMMGLLSGATSTVRSVDWNDNRYFFDESAQSPQSAFTIDGRLLDFGEWQKQTGYDGRSEVHTGRPSGVDVFVRPNRYEPGRAHIIVYNWDRRDFIDVDVSSVLAPGDHFEVRNVQNYEGAPLIQSQYEGKPLRIPVKGLKVAVPLGLNRAEPETNPEFNVFVLSRSPIVTGEPLPVTVPAPPHSRSRALETLDEQSGATALDKYVGHYRAPSGEGELVIGRSGTDLYAIAVSEQNSPRYRLVPLSDSRFRLEGTPSDFYIEFQFDGNQVVSLLAVRGSAAPPLTLYPIQ